MRRLPHIRHPFFGPSGVLSFFVSVSTVRADNHTEQQQFFLSRANCGRMLAAGPYALRVEFGRETVRLGGTRFGMVVHVGRHQRVFVSEPELEFGWGR
jgi:hypothetical protein